MDHRTLISAFALSGVLLATPQQGMAASSQWQDIGGGKARLIAVKDPTSNRIDGLIEVALEKGWKTYWKSPGGSGIAPEFDFSRSTDFFAEPVSFPVPDWIVLPDASFYGYNNSIAFPFSAEGGSNSAINLDMLIGVCEEICIPAVASFNLDADSLNRSDPKVSIQFSLAQSTLPHELAVKMPQVADSLHITRNGDTISVSGKMPSGDDTYRVVLEAKGKWVSDPVQPIMDGEQFEAKVKLPKQIAATKTPINWQINFIRHDGGDGKVSAVFEADLTKTK